MAINQEYSLNIQRQLKILKTKSFFLFGPRGVGKSTLLHSLFPSKNTYTFDLLDFDLASRLTHKPSEFSEILHSLPAHIEWVIIDEIQKISSLLDEVHRSIFKNKNLRFALTGSSARKLKKGAGNLLGGRALTYYLFPFSTQELGKDFDLKQALLYGTLPEVITSPDIETKQKTLRSYVETYLKEEIFMEGLVRQLPAFQKFLTVAASENGNLLSWANLAADIGIDAKTIRSYFEILEDTLIGFLLPAYEKSLRKQQRTHPKFYFFDTGVKRALAHELTLPLSQGTSEYGNAFEHFWITEIFRQNQYLEKDYKFSYFGTPDLEIDLVIERPGKSTLMVEFKSTTNVKERDLSGLKSIQRDYPKFDYICISSEPRKRISNSITICPWQEALETLGLAGLK